MNIHLKSLVKILLGQKNENVFRFIYFRYDNWMLITPA